MFMVNKDYH